jgi:hypothetical protein
MSQKQDSIKEFALGKSITIINLEDYKNKESVLICECRNGHRLQASADHLLKTGFECIECLALAESVITDTSPYFLALDAATYTTGMSIFNKEGQLLGHKTFSVDKKKDYFTRLKEIVQEIYSIVVKQDIKCVILEDCQYQQNPALFKKLAMLQGVIRYWVINVLGIELITAYPDEWRSYNNIFGTKRPEQKLAAIERARKIYHTEIPEDESESIFLGKYGVYQYYKNRTYKED